MFTLPDWRYRNAAIMALSQVGEYIDEINDLKQNVYVKWIRNDSPNKLTKGAISCSVKITNDGMLVMCKNYFGKFFFLKMEECAIFQKITNEEKVILTVMDFIKP